MQLDELKVGSASQIFEINSSLDSPKYPPVSVRCVKSNGRVWNGTGDETQKIYDAAEFLSFYKDRGYSENPLSIALHLKYGNFSYFTGGDMTGLQGYGLPEW